MFIYVSSFFYVAILEKKFQIRQVIKNKTIVCQNNGNKQKQKSLFFHIIHYFLVKKRQMIQMVLPIINSMYKTMEKWQKMWFCHNQMQWQLVYDQNLVSVSATETKIKFRYRFRGQNFFCLNLNFPHFKIYQKFSSVMT